VLKALLLKLILNGIVVGDRPAVACQLRLKATQLAEIPKLTCAPSVKN